MCLTHLTVFAFVLAVAWGNLTPETAYHVTPMKNQPGLYYERVRILRLQQVDWRVTTFIDVNGFLRDFPTEQEDLKDLLEKCLEATRTVFPDTYFPRGKCSELLNTEHLLSRVAHARVLTNELLTISHDSSLVKSYKDPVLRTMSKRSVPLGFIGSLSKSLFGTMNEEDAEYINSQIDKLFSDQANLTQLIGKQMHITRSKLQDLHDEHLAETKRVDAISNQLSDLYKTIGGLTRGTAEIIFRGELVNYARRVELKIDRYIEACGHYLRVITAARDGRYESTVLTTAQLLAVSREIQARTPEFEFPLSAEYLRGELLARIARADLVFHNGRMLIVAHIPLLDRMNYNLYRMYSWPVPQTNINQTGSAHISPATDYIAISVDRRTYFLADAIYVQGCRQLEQKYICSMETPLHEVSTSEQCEIIMLTRPSVDAYRKCNVRVRPQHDAFWTHLPSQGGWLFSLDKRELIHVLCPGPVETTIMLEGAGIFHLSPNCVGRTRSTALTGIRTYDSREQYFYTPDVSLNVTIITPRLSELSTIAVPELVDENHDTKKATENSPSWKSQEDGESLFEIERRILEIGTHRRDKQTQQRLFFTGFSVQAILAAILVLYFCRLRVWNFISHLCACGKNKHRLEKISLEQRGSIEAGRGPEQSTHTRRSYRFPGTSRRNEGSAVFDAEKKEVTISSGAEREDQTSSLSLPRQRTEVD